MADMENFYDVLIIINLYICNCIASVSSFKYAVQNNNSIEFGSQSNSKHQQNMFVLLFLSLFPANSLSQSNPKVCLDSICFTGSWITTSKGLKFASFQGIKYGQAPIGKLRFKPPQASESFLKTHMFFSLDLSVTEKPNTKHQMLDKVFVFEKRKGQAVCFFFKLR